MDSPSISSALRATRGARLSTRWRVGATLLASACISVGPLAQGSGAIVGSNDLGSMMLSTVSPDLVAVAPGASNGALTLASLHHMVGTGVGESVLARFLTNGQLIGYLRTWTDGVLPHHHVVQITILAFASATSASAFRAGTNFVIHARLKNAFTVSSVPGSTGFSGIPSHPVGKSINESVVSFQLNTEMAIVTDVSFNSLATQGDVTNVAESQYNAMAAASSPTNVILHKYAKIFGAALMAILLVGLVTSLLQRSRRASVTPATRASTTLGGANNATRAPLAPSDPVLATVDDVRTTTEVPETNWFHPAPKDPSAPAREFKTSWWTE